MLVMHRLFLFLLIPHFLYASICDVLYLNQLKLLKKSLKQQVVLYGSSGVQVEGKFTAFATKDKMPIYFNFTGPTKLKYNDAVIPGQDVDHHTPGFSSPIGKLKNSKGKALEDYSSADLDQVGLVIGNTITDLEFESGVKIITARVTNIINKNGKNLIISFEEAKVISPQGDILFEPSWGTYDMAVIDHFLSKNIYKIKF